MATIIIGSYMVRYPLGGNLSWAIQYLLGFKDLGHDVYMVEKYVYADSCFDPIQKKSGNDPAYGVKAVGDLMASYGLGNHWCFVDIDQNYHGISKQGIEDIFSRADVYIENGAHDAWDEESLSSSALRVYIDVDPVLTQIKFYKKNKSNQPIPRYDKYFTIGMNIGKPGNEIPTGGVKWEYLFNPVHLPFFSKVSPPVHAPYSTIMNWESYDKRKIKFEDKSYGYKDMEFEKFLSLPEKVNARLEIAVAGLPEKKQAELMRHGWYIRNAQEVTLTVDHFKNYLSACKGEFSVVKNMYQASNSGWFSDKSAAFMASGRPVVLQETGFSEYIPTGEGVFAVHDLNEAKEAIEMIEGNYEHHSDKAYEVANEYLSARKVLGKFLNDIGV